MYTPPKNSPYIPNIQKNIARKKYAEKHPKTQFVKPPYTQRAPRPKQNPLVDLQIYEAFKPKPPRRQPTPQVFAPLGQGYGYQLPYTHGIVPTNVVKTYNINVSGPMANHGKVSQIYEDILPGKGFSSTMNTLGERRNIHNFIRSTFIKQSDGENINLNENNGTSLMSHLKLINMNPYNTNTHSDNPYKGLPDNMLIYNSCYPIRHNIYTNTTQCAKDSVGMNVRIYRLNANEYNSRNTQTMKNYAVWRELMYYEYITKHIIKNNVSPNFPMLHAHFICENCNINFDRLANIKKTTIPQTPGSCYDGKLVGKPTVHSTFKQTSNKHPILPPPIEFYKPTPTKTSVKTTAINTALYDKFGNELTKMNQQGGALNTRGLVLLTESPNYSIYKWASKSYNSELGNIKKMTNTGIHNTNVWKSVLFQIMSALYVMQINNIAITEFDMENNVYIKDVSSFGKATRYWKYIIEGVDYYVPNHGYLAILDSNYRDVENKHKKYGKIFGDADTDTHQLCFNAFKKALNPNTFSNNFVARGGTKPPTEIIQLLENITRETQSNNTDISHYIQMFMRKFMNNRIGTHLKQMETSNVRKDDTTPFINGRLVAYEVQYNTYIFALFISSDENNARVIIKSNNNFEETTVPKSSLFNYSKFTPIEQEFRADRANLNESDLLEVYIIKK